MKEYKDTFIKEDKLFKYIYDLIHNDYTNQNKIELVYYNSTTEKYLINDRHNATLHFHNEECFKIDIVRRY